jgi:hypothetical protein
MKTLFTTVLFLIVITGFSQQTLWTEGFEGSWPPSEWQVLTSTSISQEPYEFIFPNLWDNWFHNDVNQAPPWGSYYIHSGEASTAVGGCLGLTDLTYDWLVTDTFSIPDSNYVYLKYWMWMHSAINYQTDFYILAKPNGSAQWTLIKHHNFAGSYNHYDEELTEDISAYKNTFLNLAFVHNSTYQFALDDMNLVVSDALVNINEGVPIRNINIYPNPARDAISIKADVSLLGSGFIIKDLSGKLVIQGQLLNENTSIGIQHLPPGFYFLKVINDNPAEQTHKIIKL